MSGTLSLHDDPTGEDRVSRSAILYLVLETERPAAGSVRIDLGRAGSVLVGRGPERAVKNDGPELKLEIPDGRISSSHARFRRVAGRWMVEDLQSKNGTLVRGEPITKHVLEDGDNPFGIGQVRLGHGSVSHVISGTLPDRLEVCLEWFFQCRVDLLSQLAFSM